MSEKVKVSREVYEALRSTDGWELYRESMQECLVRHRMERLFGGERSCLNKVDFDTFLKAIVNGYEVEETPEEKLLNVWQSTWDEYNRITDFQNRPGGGYENGFAKGIEKAIDILGIQIKGINK